LGEQVEKFMAGLSVEDLPGVGWMLRNKLHSHKLYKCSDLLSVSKVWFLIVKV
jgi:DNA repair protein REV1